MFWISGTMRIGNNSDEVSHNVPKPSNEEEEANNVEQDVDNILEGATVSAPQLPPVPPKPVVR